LIQHNDEIGYGLQYGTDLTLSDKYLEEWLSLKKSLNLIKQWPHVRNWYFIGVTSQYVKGHPGDFENSKLADFFIICRRALPSFLKVFGVKQNEYTLQTYIVSPIKEC